jgi:uncharacterized protein (DUF1697 family)
MPTNVAMLRGVNVGARNRINMKDLEALFARLGHTSVITYIQSGNVVFNSRSKSSATVARAIEEQIARDLGLEVAVLLRTKAELARVERVNPFLRTVADTAHLHVTFLAEDPDATLVQTVEAFDGGPDELRVRGREVFLHCPTGYGNTKLNNGFLERKLHAIATTRNWKTVTKLVELAG